MQSAHTNLHMSLDTRYCCININQLPEFLLYFNCLRFDTDHLDKTIEKSCFVVACKNQSVS